MNTNYTSLKDRRKEPRRKVTLEVLFALKRGLYNLTNWTEGKIADASPGGIRITASTLPGTNRAIEIFCVLPRNEETLPSNHPNNHLYYRITGRVVWVCEKRGEMGVMLT